MHPTILSSRRPAKFSERFARHFSIVDQLCHTSTLVYRLGIPLPYIQGFPELELNFAKLVETDI